MWRVHRAWGGKWLSQASSSGLPASQERAEASHGRKNRTRVGRAVHSLFQAPDPQTLKGGLAAAHTSHGTPTHARCTATGQAFPRDRLFAMARALACTMLAAILLAAVATATTATATELRSRKLLALAHEPARSDAPGRRLLGADAAWAWARTDTVADSAEDGDPAGTGPSVPGWAEPSITLGTAIGEGSSTKDEESAMAAIDAEAAAAPTVSGP